MAGLPRKYAKMGFKRGWAAYRKKRKAPKTSKKRSAKKAKPMARRSRRRSVRRFIRSRTHTVPVVDALHGVYTLDGMTGNRASKTVSDGIGLLTGKTGSTSVIENDVQGAIDYVSADPKKAIIGGVKNFATIFFVRKVLGWVGVPKSVKLFGKTRIQVR